MAALLKLKAQILVDGEIALGPGKADLLEAIAAHGSISAAARALGLAQEVGSLEPGRAADLAVWRIAEPAELGYWLGLVPERRIFGGQDQ